MAFRTTLIIAAACLLLSRGATAQEWPTQVSADAEKLVALGKAGDLPAMGDFIRTQMPKWEALGARWYGHLMRRAVQILGTGAFEDRRRSRDLKRDLARTALQKSGEITLEDQVLLTRSLRVDLLRPRPPEEWPLERRQDAKLWLRTWKRLHDTIDPGWVNETVYWNMLPPLESGQPSGVAPQAIKDPELRARYEADLEANRKRNKRNSEQLRARKRARSFLPWAKRYMADIYSHPPYALEELRNLLLEYVADEEARTEILSRVTAAMGADR